MIDEHALIELLARHLGEHERSMRRTLVVLKSTFSLAGREGVEQSTAAHVRAANAG